MITLDAIVSALLAGLAVDLGTYDVSGTDQVVEGSYQTPPGPVPMVCVVPPRMTASVAQARGVWYLETHEIELRGWAPVTVTTTPVRADEARQLAAEIIQRLDQLRDDQSSVLYRCVEWAVTAQLHEPSGDTGTWLARADVTLTISYRRQSGTGA